MLGKSRETGGRTKRGQKVTRSRRVRVSGVMCLSALSLAAVFAAVGLSASSGSVPKSTLPHAAASGPEQVREVPAWELSLLHAKHRVAVLPHVVPEGGVALISPGSTSATDPILTLQPANPTATDITASQADQFATTDMGPDISGTVFGIGTMPTFLEPAGTPIPDNAVVNKPVWVVTITPPQPFHNPLCGSVASQDSCGPDSGETFTSWVLVLDGQTGAMLEGFNQ